jgi:single stranded DNA-binding protein (ssb)
MNTFHAIGRLTRKPELKNGGNANFCTFTIAVDRDYRVEGEKICDFIPCIAWRKTADAVYTRMKGELIAVSGRLESSTYQNENGMKRTAYQIMVHRVEFLEYKKERLEKEEASTSSFVDGVLSEEDDTFLPFDISPDEELDLTGYVDL